MMIPKHIHGFDTGLAAEITRRAPVPDVAEYRSISSMSKTESPPSETSAFIISGRAIPGAKCLVAAMGFSALATALQKQSGVTITVY